MIYKQFKDFKTKYHLINLSEENSVAVNLRRTRNAPGKKVSVFWFREDWSRGSAVQLNIAPVQEGKGQVMGYLISPVTANCVVSLAAVVTVVPVPHVADWHHVPGHVSPHLLPGGHVLGARL